jgi:hypothetical protein
MFQSTQLLAFGSTAYVMDQLTDKHFPSYKLILMLLSISSECLNYCRQPDGGCERARMVCTPVEKLMEY